MLTVHKFLLSLLLLVLTSAVARAQSLEPDRQLVEKPNTNSSDPLLEPSPYPGGFFDSLRESYYSSIYGGADALAVSLFESISNIDIFSQAVGPGNVAINIQRRIFNNHDISESWTVMDIMRVPFSIPLIPSTNIPVGPLSVSVAATGQLSLSHVHIRQVMPSHLQQLADVKQTEQEMSNMLVNNKAVVESEAPSKNTFWLKVAKFFKGDFNEARTRAQLNKLYNLLAAPFQFPFTEKGLLKMPENDIRIYAFEGLLQLSAGVGFSISAVPGIDLFNMGVGPSVYVGGRWQVAMLKLPGNKLKVKITRITDNGRVFSFGAQHRWDIFKGFVVFGENLGKISQTLIPFQFSVSKEHANQFDIGYEFDLSKPEALDAAHKMIGGQVALSQQLARQSDSGVQWSFRRDQKSSTSTMAKGVHLDFLFYYQRITKTQKIDAVLTLPDGEHHYFKGISDSVMAWDSVFGGRELKAYSFQTLTDNDALSKNDDKAMILRMSGTIEDARTTGKEMRKYVREVEVALGNDKIFDDYPTHLQKDLCVLKLCKKVTRVASYGASSFLYRITMRKNQIETFIHENPARVWQALERAYAIKAGAWSTSTARRNWALIHSPLTALNIPLALFQANIRSGDKLISASRFFKHWEKLRQYQSDPKKLTFSLGEMFRTHYFGPELINTMMKLQKDKPFDYTLAAANSQLFPSMSLVQQQTPYNDLLIDSIQKQIDFEAPRYWQRTNIENKINKFAIKKIGQDKVEITFNLQRAPSLLFFSISKKRLIGQKHLNHFVLAANPQGDTTFVQGDNRIVLGLHETIEWKNRMASFLLMKGQNQLQLSYTSSIDEGWGPLAGANVIWTHQPAVVTY